MRTKAAAITVIVAVVIAVAIGMRTANRADAAAGNCYAGEQGPATPTVCN